MRLKRLRGGLGSHPLITVIATACHTCDVMTSTHADARADGCGESTVEVEDGDAKPAHRARLSSEEKAERMAAKTP